MLFSFNDTKGNAQVRSNTFGYVFEFFYIGSAGKTLKAI